MPPVTGANTKGPNDQKILNEELIVGIAEVARRHPPHAAELFGIGLGVAVRMAALTESQIDDLATTSVALWRPRLDEAEVRRLAERQRLPSPEFEPYRPVLERINRLALATFVRHAVDPVSAALVCDLVDPQVTTALAELPAFAVMEWGGNPGRPLVMPLLSEPLIDRLLRDACEPVDAALRGLFAFTLASEPEFERLQSHIARDARGTPAEGSPPGKRSGRPVSSFLMPRTSALILLMLRHRMRPTEVEDRLLATADVRAVQLRGLAESLNPRPKRAKGAPRDRSRDHRDLWGSAHRRMTATAIYRLQCRLVEAQFEPFEAMVRAYDYYVGTYDAHCGVSLSRMLRDVFSPLRQGGDTRLSHCSKCGVVHLSHEEKAGIIECPVCVLARAGRFGARRTRVLRTEAPLARPEAAWSGGPLWFGGGPVPGAAVQGVPGAGVPASGVQYRDGRHPAPAPLPAR